MQMLFLACRTYKNWWWAGFGPQAVVLLIPDLDHLSSYLKKISNPTTWSEILGAC